MSFRTKLVLAAAYLVTAVVVALEVPLALTIERRAESEFRSAVLGNAAVLAAQAGDLVAPPNSQGTAEARSLSQLVENAPRAGERVVVTDRRSKGGSTSDAASATHSGRSSSS